MSWSNRFYTIIEAVFYKMKGTKPFFFYYYYYSQIKSNVVYSLFSFIREKWILQPMIQSAQRKFPSQVGCDMKWINKLWSSDTAEEIYKYIDYKYTKNTNISSNL